jgi:hypothetical protein
MQDSAGAKQQIVERVKQSTNILVTVNSSPSVDALSALLAFALMLNKLDKHATAVFSGVVPPAIKFLQPDKTFENNVDSLRDFIIALDKEKADRLRYKVENDVVKIFITPYRTTITDKDLQFSQGDFNVDLIIALGVEKRDELDKTIVAHGRILHDAAVMTINAADQKSSLGSVDWQDSGASSLSEMLVSLSEALKPNLLDQQISTALLTGIVSATERFSNRRTTPRVMTMAAQLMASGANQQLIANNLRVESPAPQPDAQKPVDVPAEKSAKVSADQPKANGEMVIKHADEPQVPQPAAEVPVEPPTSAEPEPELPIAPPPASNFAQLKQALQEETAQQSAKPEDSSNKATINAAQPKPDEPETPKKEEDQYITSKPSWMGRNIQPPTLGSALSATAQEALDNKMREEIDQRNHTLLSHDDRPRRSPAQRQPEPQQPSTVPEAPAAPAAEPEVPEVSQQPNPEPLPAAEPPQSEPALAEQPKAEPQPEGSAMDSVTLRTEPTLEELERRAKAHSAEALNLPANIDAARQAVDDALVASPLQPGQPADSIGAQEMPAAPEPPQPPEPASEPAVPPPSDIDEPLPTGLTLPAPQPEPSAAPAQSPLSPMPQMPSPPPLPDFSTLPPATPPIDMPTPPIQPPEQTPPPASPDTNQSPSPPDPGQFKIPGQP